MWVTLSPLIFCYTIFFIIGLLFVKFLKKINKLYFVLILLLSFLAIFTREELYHLPFFLFIILIYVSKFKKKHVNRCQGFLIIAIIFLIVFFHFLLRGVFVNNAPQLNLAYSSIVGFIKSGLSTGLPGGLKTYTLEEKSLQFLWLLGLMIITLSFFYNYNRKNFIKIAILFAIIILLTSPSLVRSRDFGIFLPSVFTFSLFSILISEFYNLNKKYNFISLLVITKIVIFSTLATGLLAGYKRSIQHQLTWSSKSIYQLSGDSYWLYGERFKNVSIPLERKKKKREQLEKVNIKKQVSTEDVINFLASNTKLTSNEIIIPRHKPLKF